MEIYLTFILIGIMTIFVIAAIMLAMEQIIQRIQAMIYAATETILEEQKKQFENAEDDRRHIETRLHWSKKRQQKILRTLHNK